MFKDTQEVRAVCAHWELLYPNEDRVTGLTNPPSAPWLCLSEYKAEKKAPAQEKAVEKMMMP